MGKEGGELCAVVGSGYVYVQWGLPRARSPSLVAVLGQSACTEIVTILFRADSKLTSSFLSKSWSKKLQFCKLSKNFIKVAQVSKNS